MVAIEIRKKLVAPVLLNNQMSITEIPRKLYEHFSVKKITGETKTETNGEIRLWCELPINSTDKTDKVIAIFTERDDGDAIETKFALTPWYPDDEHYGDSYDFEIFAIPQSKGWSHGKGSRFIEVLSYQTKNCIRNPLVANHPLADYIALALIKMRNLLKVHASEIVRQEFIDNAPKAPR